MCNQKLDEEAQSSMLRDGRDPSREGVSVTASGGQKDRAGCFPRECGIHTPQQRRKGSGSV